jgi:hypothetical protein
MIVLLPTLKYSLPVYFDDSYGIFVYLRQKVALVNNVLLLIVILRSTSST